MRKVTLPWDTTALVAATAKTIAEIPAPSTTDLELCELIIGCDASSAGNLKVELGTFTTTGTGTAVSAPGIFNASDRVPASFVTAAKISDSIEPTGFTGVISGAARWPGLLVPLPMYIVFQFPLGEGLTIPHSTNFAVRLTASIGCNTAGWASWKE